MIQEFVAESYAERQAARLLTLQAAWTMDELHAAGKHYSDARLEIGVIKFWGAKVLYNVIDRAIQVHGSLGYTTDLPLESMYRHARAARIYDGPDEVHKVTVARQVLKNYRASRGAERARPDPPRRGDREVRRPARGHQHQRLLSGLGRPGPTSGRIGNCSTGGHPWPPRLKMAGCADGRRAAGSAGALVGAGQLGDGDGRRAGDGLEVVAGEAVRQLGLLARARRAGSGTCAARRRAGRGRSSRRCRRRSRPRRRR